MWGGCVCTRLGQKNHFFFKLYVGFLKVTFCPTDYLKPYFVQKKSCLTLVMSLFNFIVYQLTVIKLDFFQFLK